MNNFAGGLPVDFSSTVELATTLKVAISAARKVDTQIREKGLENVEKGEKRKLE